MNTLNTNTTNVTPQELTETLNELFKSYLKELESNAHSGWSAANDREVYKVGSLLQRCGVAVKLPGYRPLHSLRNS